MDKNQLSSAHNISNTSKFITTKTAPLQQQTKTAIVDRSQLPSQHRVQLRYFSTDDKDSSQISNLQQILFNMKIYKKKVKFGTLLVNLINAQKIQLEKILKKVEHIAIKCRYIPSDTDSGPYEINFPYYDGESPEKWLLQKDKLFEAIDRQSISMGPERYKFTKKLLTGDAEVTFNQVILDMGICIVHNFNKVLKAMTQKLFSVFAFCEQKRYLRRHQIKPRNMKLRSFVSSI